MSQHRKAAIFLAGLLLAFANEEAFARLGESTHCVALPSVVAALQEPSGAPSLIPHQLREATARWSPDLPENPEAHGWTQIDLREFMRQQAAR